MLPREREFSKFHLSIPLMNLNRAGIYLVLITAAGLAIWLNYRDSAKQNAVVQEQSQLTVERAEMKRKILLEEEVRAEVEHEQRQKASFEEKKLSSLQEQQNELRRQVEAMRKPNN